MIHRFWIGPPHPRATWTGTVIDTTCAGTRRDWTPDTLPASIDVPDDPDPRHVANVVRYQLLHEFGGLWLDHDVIPLTNLCRARGPWVAGMGPHRSACVMWFPEPGHPLLAALVDDAMLTTTGLSRDRSGDRLLGRLLPRYHDVGVNEAVLPYDSVGRRVRRLHGQPEAIHLWETSSERHLTSS